MSRVNDIAADVVSVINDGGLGIVAVLDYEAVYTLDETETMKVVVDPGSLTYTQHTRVETMKEVVIDVVVLLKVVKFPDDMQTGLDMMEDIAALFDRSTTMTNSKALWIETTNDPSYMREHVENMRQFTSVLSLTFVVT